MGFKRFATADFENDKFDSFSRAVTVIDENHRLIHEGWFYTATYRNTAVANGATLDILIAVPAGKVPHLQLLEIVTDGGPISYQLDEAVTTSADGTALPSYNRNRTSSNVAATVLTHTPTVTDTGLEIEAHNVPAIGNKVGIFDQTSQGEWMLKPSTKYLLRVTNDSGQARDIEARLAFYEIDWNTGVQ